MHYAHLILQGRYVFNIKGNRTRKCIRSKILPTRKAILYCFEVSIKEF